MDTSSYLKNVSFQTTHDHLMHVSHTKHENDRLIDVGVTCEFSATFVGVSSLEDAVRVLVKSLGWTLVDVEHGS